MEEKKDSENGKDRIDDVEHCDDQTYQRCQCQQKHRYRQYVVYEEDILANLNDWD